MTEEESDILRRFRTAVGKIYGDRLERVVLFGSRARGDARPNSDFDVAVFIREHRSFTEEATRLADAELDIEQDTGAVIIALPFPAGAYGHMTGFMHELRRDGLDL